MRQVLLSSVVGLACGLAVAGIAALAPNTSHTGQMVAGVAGGGGSGNVVGRQLPLHITVIHDPDMGHPVEADLGRDAIGEPFTARYRFRDRATAERAADDVLGALLEYRRGPGASR